MHTQQSNNNSHLYVKSSFENQKTFLENYFVSKILDLRITSHFHYCGLFSKKVMFGIYNEEIILKNNKKILNNDTINKKDIKTIEKVIYLKPNERIIVLLYKFNFERVDVMNKNNNKALIKNAFRIPLSQWDAIFDDKKMLDEIYSAYIKDSQEKEIEKKNPKIRKMLNLNNKVEAILYRAGIESVDKFIELGTVKTFVKVLKSNQFIYDNLLFKLYGAENKILYQMIKPEQILMLKKELNEELKQENMPDYFKPNDLVLKNSVEMGWFVY